LYLAACEWFIYLKNRSIVPSAYSENKSSPSWMEKSYRLTQFLPKIPKNLADKPSSQHRLQEHFALFAANFVRVATAQSLCW
jgi:hypothetical protein